MDKRAICVLAMVAAFLNCRVGGQNEAELDKAIAVLKSQPKAEMSESEIRADMELREKAFNTIESAGEPGAKRLEAELAGLTGAPKQKAFFQLAAADLIWRIRGLKSAAQVAELWTHIEHPRVAEATFMTAFEAARKQDVQAVPLMRFSLAATDAEAFLPVHSMAIPWPQTAEILWGACGQPCLAQLRVIFQETTNPAEAAAATYVLSRTLDPEVLPRIRQMASSGKGIDRLEAIRALGWYGHPDDFESLRAGLKAKDRDTQFKSLFALIDFGDTRAMPDIMPFLESSDEEIKKEATFACTYLPTSDSINWLLKQAALKENAEDWRIQEQLAGFCEELGIEKDAFTKLPVEQRDKLISDAPRLREESYKLKAGERPVSHAQFVEQVQEWTSQGRMPESVSREVHAAATPDDIPLLIALKSRLYHRLSDECFYETRVVDDIVKRLGRSRYRKQVGTTAQAEPPGK